MPGQLCKGGLCFNEFLSFNYSQIKREEKLQNPHNHWTSMQSSIIKNNNELNMKQRAVLHWASSVCSPQNPKLIPTKNRIREPAQNPDIKQIMLHIYCIHSQKRKHNTTHKQL